MASFFSSLFGRNEKKTDESNPGGVYPPDNFSIVQGELEGMAITGSVNKGYKNYSHKAEYPWCLHIGIALKPEHVQTNGLPKDDESDFAYQHEEELMEEIKKIGVTHFIGHIFNDGFLDAYMYIADPEPVHGFLKTQINKDGLLRGFGYEIKKDEDWAKAETLLS